MIDRSLNSILGSQSFDFSPVLEVFLTELPVQDLALNALFIAFVALLAGLIVAEKRHAHRHCARAELRQSYLTNLGSYLVNDFTLSLCQVPVLYAVATRFADTGLLSGMEDGWGKTLLAFVLLDLTLYGWHALSHHCDALWILHRVHHSDRSVNVTTGLRYHLGEMLLEALLRAGFIVVVGVPAETLLVCQGVMSLFILMHHSNLRLPAESLLGKIVITPSLHRTHHSVVRAEHDSNYGAVFSIWDQVFGTLSLRTPKAFGLPGNRVCEPYGGVFTPGTLARWADGLIHGGHQEVKSVRIISRREESNQR